VADGFQISVTAKNLKFDKYALSAEDLIIDAIDVTIGEVQAHIRDGHPKVNKLTLKRTRGDRDSLDTYRVRTGGEVGEFRGMMRWLTHTGVSRNSVFLVQAKVSGTGFTRSISGKVYSAQKHMNDLEFGTAGRRAFPAFRPALIAKGPRGQYLVREALLRAAARL